MAMAQTPPASYTIKQNQAMTGQPVVFYRNGDQAAIEFIHKAGDSSGNTRSVKDLATHVQFDWDITHPDACSRGKWGGDWGDPFAAGKEFQEELSKQHPKLVGTETVAGMTAKVYEASLPDGTKAKMWVEEKIGLVLKLQVTDASGKSTSMGEITSVTLGPPAASIFEVPPSCLADNTPPEEREFADATKAPASAETCTIYVRLLKAGSMEPILTGFHLGFDGAINPRNPPQHTAGFAPDGHAVFGGGAIHDMTGQFKNGVLFLGRIGPQFDIETVWDNNAGGSTAMLYRQCFGASTTLLLVVKDPATIGKGIDYRWDKTGKYLSK